MATAFSSSDSKSKLLSQAQVLLLYARDIIGRRESDPTSNVRALNETHNTISAKYNDTYWSDPIVIHQCTPDGVAVAASALLTGCR